MSDRRSPGRRGTFFSGAAGTALLAMIGAVGLTPAQTPPAPAPTATTMAPAAPAADGTAVSDPNIQPAGCSTCGGGLLGGGGVPYDTGYPVGGGCPSCCHAGQKGCNCCWDAKTCVGKCFAGLYECLCCPDPCYEPRWIPVANSAFFVDAARPVTQMRLRYDAGFNFKNPDRAEYFMPRFKLFGNNQQLGPGGPCAPANIPGKGMNCLPSKIDYQDISLYNEAAIGNFSMFTSYSYRHLDPTTSPISAALADPLAPCCPESGFTDLLIGTKSLLLDCELLQFAFQFTTYIPTGAFPQGLGTGHVSLEPSFLWSLKLTPDAYMQGQTAYWIPIGGDPLYQSDIFHSHLSFNQILCKPCCDFQVVGTLEFNEWTIFQGAYTSDTVLLPRPENAGILAPVALSSSTTIFSAGPGIRMYICNKADVGVGTAFNFTGATWAQQLIRTEVRFRF